MPVKRILMGPPEEKSRIAIRIRKFRKEYYARAGAHRHKRDAKKQQKYLKNRGVKSVRITRGKSVHNVWIPEDYIVGIKFARKHGW